MLLKFRLKLHEKLNKNNKGRNKIVSPFKGGNINDHIK